jgi:CRP-like cAMP-binding protein
LDASLRSPNHLLASLSAEDFALLRPHLHDVELVHQSVLAKTEDRLERAYFPHSGVISLVLRLDGGEMIEVAMIGRDSIFGAAASLDGRISMNEAIVQLPGFASAIDIAHLRRAANQSDTVRSALVRHEEFLFAQVQQSAACNAAHALTARLARRLLRIRDLAGSDRFFLTQEFLAQMLGAQRTSVSPVANTLNKAGLIRYHRGNIEVLDLEGLVDSACECYSTVKAHAKRLSINGPRKLTGAPRQRSPKRPAKSRNL